MMVQSLRRALLCILPALLYACSESASTVTDPPDAGADVPVVMQPDNTPASIDTEAPMQVRAGDEVMARCVIRNRAGQTLTLADARPEITYDPAMSVRQDGARTIASRVGSVQVRCALASAQLTDDTPATMEIVAGVPARVTTTLDRNTITAGESATATCAVTDAEGNALTGVAATIATTPMGEGVTVNGMSVSATRSGMYAVACRVTGAMGDPASLTVSPALPASLMVTRMPDRMVYRVDDEIDIVATVLDRYGNRIEMPMLSFDSAPMGGTAVRPGRFRYGTEGRYTVTVQVTGPTEMGRMLRETTSFVVDSSGPAITCVGDATMIDLMPGAPLMVRGTLRDTSGVRSARVAGNEVTVGTDGSFMATVTSRFGMNFVEVRSTDTLGMENVRTCTFLVSNRWQPESGLLNDGVTLQLAQAALDDGNPVSPITSVDDILQTVINSQGLSDQLHTSLLGANPLYNDCVLRPCVFGVCTCLASERVDYRDRELNGPNTTSLTLVDGGLRAHVRLENLGIRLRVDGTIDTDAWARFRSLDVDLIFDLSSNNGTPVASVRAGSVSVTVGSISVEIVGSGIANNILNALVDVVTSLAQGALRNTVSTQLRNYVQNNFNAVLNDLFRGLNVSSLGTSFNVPRLDGSGNVALGFGLGISNLNATSARLLAGIGTRFSVMMPSRTTTSRGVALQPASATEPGRTTPATVIVQPGVINQALHTLWRGGFFDARLNGLGMSAMLPAGSTITLATALPPVSSIRSDGRVNLDLGALTGSLNLGGSAAPIQITLGARASTAVALMGNDLRFSDVRLEEVYVTLENSSMSAMENENLRMALRVIVQELVDTSLNNALPAIPIPGFRIPDSLRTYGLPVGRELGITSPALGVEQGLFVLRGGFGVR